MFENKTSLLPTDFGKLFNESIETAVEKIQLPEKMRIDYPKLSQTELKNAFDVAKDIGNCFTINFNKKFLSDGLSTDTAVSGCKLEKVPIAAMNLIIGINNEVFCIDVDESEWNSIPLVVRMGEEYRPVVKLKRDDGEEEYIQLDFLHALFLTGRRKGEGKKRGCDTVYMVSVSSSADGFSHCEAAMFPDCKPPYDFLNQIRRCYRLIGKEGDHNGNV